MVFFWQKEKYIIFVNIGNLQGTGKNKMEKSG